MYRIFCESFKNYRKQNNGTDYRSTIVKPFELIVNVELFNKEKKEETDLYKRFCDLLYYMEKNKKEFPRFQSFLWTLESRNMIGKNYEKVSNEDLHEQSKIVNMFLKLVYWYVAI